MGQRFRCPVCEYKATTKGKLISHQKSTHMDQKFPCPKCEFQAKQKGQLINHYNSLDMGPK